MKSYNFIYSKLVQDQYDFIGKIAYSIYKEDKINYINTIKDKNNREPNDNELESFIMISSQDSYIERYRLEAENLLQIFLEHTLSEAIEENIEKVKDNYAITIRNEVNKIKPAGFWIGVLQGIVSSIVITAFFALLLLIINFTTDGFWETIGKLFNYNITPKK